MRSTTPAHRFRPSDASDKTAENFDRGNAIHTRARFGSTKPDSGSQVAKKSPEIQIAATIHRVEQLAGRAAWDAYSYGERAYDPPHVRHLLLVLSRRVADERSDAPIRAR